MPESTVTRDLRRGDMFEQVVRGSFGNDLGRLLWVGQELSVWRQSHRNAYQAEVNLELQAADARYEALFERGEPAGWSALERLQRGLIHLMEGASEVPEFGFVLGITAGLAKAEEEWLKPVFRDRFRANSWVYKDRLEAMVREFGDGVMANLQGTALRDPEYAAALQQYSAGRLQGKADWRQPFDLPVVAAATGEEEIPYPVVTAQRAAPRGTAVLELRVDDLRAFVDERLGGLEEAYLAPTLSLLKDVDGKVETLGRMVNALGSRVEKIDKKTDLISALVLRQAVLEEQRAKRQEIQAKTELALGVFGSSMSIVCRLVGEDDPAEARRIAAVGQVVAFGITMGGELAACASLGGIGQALGSGALTGNFAVAALNLAQALMGSTSPEQLVLNRLAAIQEQLEQFQAEVTARFDHVDTMLGLTIGRLYDVLGQVNEVQVNLDEIEVRLLDLLAEVQRVETTLTRYFRAERVREVTTLRTRILGYELRTGTALPFVGDEASYERAASELYDFGTGPSVSDEVATGGQRPVADADLAAQLSAAGHSPAQNVDYIGEALLRQGLPSFKNPGETLPNPDLWCLAAVTLAELNATHPGYALVTPQLESERQELLAVGERLAEQLDGLWISGWDDPAGPTPNGDLVTGLCGVVRASTQRLVQSFDTVEADYLTETGLPAGLDVWNPTSAPAPSDALAWVVLEADQSRRVQAWASLETLIPGRYLASYWLARQAGESPELRVQLRLDGSRNIRLGISISVSLAVRGAAYPFIGMSRTVPVNGFVRGVSQQNLFDWYFEPWWRQWLRAEFDRGLYHRISAPPVLAPYEAVMGPLRDHPPRHVAEILTRFARHVDQEARELDGVCALVRSVIELCLPQSLSSSDLLRALLYGEERLLDGRLALDYVRNAYDRVVRHDPARPRQHPQPLLLDVCERRLRLLEATLDSILAARCADRCREVRGELAGPLAFVRLTDAVLERWKAFLTTASLPVLRPGDEGPAVERLTTLLNAAVGDVQPIPVGDRFTDDVAEALDLLQRRHRLPLEQVVGPTSWAVLLGLHGEEPQDPGVVVEPGILTLTAPATAYAAPTLESPVVAHLAPGTYTGDAYLHHGQKLGGIDRWYRVPKAVTAGAGWLHASGVAYRFDDSPIVEPVVASIDLHDRALAGRRLHAHGALVGGYAVRLQSPAAASTEIAVSCSPGVRVDTTTLHVPAGATSASFGVRIGPGVAGPCWIRATSRSGTSVTAMFEAVALLTFEMADGTPLNGTMAPGGGLGVRVRLTGAADYNDGLKLEADPGLVLDRPAVAMMANVPYSQPFTVTAQAGHVGPRTLRARNQQMEITTDITVTP